MNDFKNLQVMSQVVRELRLRASKGCYRVDQPLDNAYLRACRIASPELQAVLLMAFEDLEPYNPPADCRYALHFAVMPMRDEVLQQCLAANPRVRVYDSPSRKQRLHFTQTAFGPDWPDGWCRTEQHDGEAQLHCWLFAKPNHEKHSWEPIAVNSAWPRASGMRRLAEYFA